MEAESKMVEESRFDTGTIEEVFAALHKFGVKKVEVQFQGDVHHISCKSDCLNDDGEQMDMKEIPEDKVRELILNNIFGWLALEAARPLSYGYDECGQDDDQGTLYQGIKGSVAFDVSSRTASLEAIVRLKTISLDDIGISREWNCIDKESVSCKVFKDYSRLLEKAI
jgi:hypothetical protein